MACTSFVRELASQWETQTYWPSDMPLLDMTTLPHVDTALFFRDELIAFIREHGGVTEKAGARRDGRLRILTSRSDVMGKARRSWIENPV